MIVGGFNAVATGAIARPAAAASASSASTTTRRTSSVLVLNTSKQHEKGARVAAPGGGRGAFFQTSSPSGDVVNTRRRRRRAGIITFAGADDDANTTTTTGGDDSSSAAAAAAAATSSESDSGVAKNKNAVVDKAVSEFDSKIRDIASGGLTSALRAVDQRLEIAMKREAAGGTSSNGVDASDGEALAAAREASQAESQAVDIVACLQAAGTLRGYGAARLVPRRDYALAELKLNGIEAEKLLAPTESTISGLRDLVSRALLVLFGGWVLAAHPAGNQITGTLVGGAGVLAADQIVFGGGMEALVLDTLAQATSSSYKSRLQLHEAAHFLVAYLMGILPKGYTLSSLDAYNKYGALNVQAGCAFCDGAFQREVARGKIGAGSLGRFSCVALAGISMEYVAYGFAEGGVADVRQLDGMLRALAFSQQKSDSEVRWAVLNTITLLRRHENVVRKLSERMAAGGSVGECVALIEENLADDV